MKSLSILGDSILRGVVLNNDTRKYSISDSIGIDSIAERYSLEITNLSRFGCTIDRGFEYMKKFLQRGNRVDAVILELGGNDSDFNWAEVAASPDTEHLPHTPLDSFIAKYNEILDYLSERGIAAVTTNLPPLCPERYLDWVCRDGLSRENIMKWLGSINTIYRYQENYSLAIERTARERGTPCIDLRGAFLANRRIEALYCEDGIHPNKEGQAIIHDALLSAFDKRFAAAI